MKKTVKQKEFQTKKSQLQALKFFEDKFVMVKYSDLKLIPNQAQVLGFIRGMIKNNEKNPKMKADNRVWMKETTQKMAFLLGLGESTLKDHIKKLVGKGYLKRDNHSTIVDNTNWYWIDEIRLQNDFKDHLLKLELEVKQLEDENKEFKSEFEKLDFNDLEDDNNLVYSQNLNLKESNNKHVLGQNSANENTETSSTIIYNSNIILENESYNSIEYSKSEVGSEVGSEVDINIKVNNSSETKERLDKKYCFDQIDSIFPKGWYDYLVNNGGENFFKKYYDFVKNYDDEMIEKISIYLGRILQ
jgi:DNA-binding MarR family transcriptional regulator